MNYHFSMPKPASQYLEIQFSIELNGQGVIKLQLPAWRPGRYELGNFAKNIQRFEVKTERGEDLNFKKVSKDAWLINTEGVKSLHINYNYYSSELNAGSTFIDGSQMYVNPVNCCLYVPNLPDEKCHVSLDVPKSFKVATGLKSTSEFNFEAENFDQLADSPFIASAGLQHHQFESSDCLFHLWFQGECKPDFKRIEKDFIDYTRAQVALFGDFPCEEYHYLFQILPHRAYHGVEHSNSTVILLGPGYNLMEENGQYNELLGVCSHELFHTWNIKRIRPEELSPYDFSKENYTRLGYLAEGATTWYGDEMLKRSGVFNEAAYCKTLKQLLERHFNNPGVLNMSVADSSFDTWLDGYVPGVPNRKSSIYVEGALITLMLDVIIRKNSKGEHSFDDVMKSFYLDFYRSNKAITEEDYKITVEKFAGTNLDEFFEKFINGNEDIDASLKEAFQFKGFQYERLPSQEFHEAHLGFRYVNDKVTSIYPNSPAAIAGLSVQDKILSINGYALANDLSKWSNYFSDQIILQVVSAVGMHKEIELKANKEEIYYAEYEVKAI